MAQYPPPLQSKALSDTEQQFIDDLEKAKALSLETLALEKFKRERQLGRRSCKGSTHTPPVPKVERSASLELKPRPRPGPVSTVSGTGPLAPPPSARRSTSREEAKTTDDLMSFHSPPPTDKQKEDSFTLPMQTTTRITTIVRSQWPPPPSYPTWSVNTPQAGWQMPPSHAPVSLPLYPGHIYPTVPVASSPPVPMFLPQTTVNGNTDQLRRGSMPGSFTSLLPTNQQTSESISVASQSETVSTTITVQSSSIKTAPTSPYKSLRDQLKATMNDQQSGLDLMDLSLADDLLSSQTVLEVFDPLLSTGQEHVWCPPASSEPLYDAYDPFEYLYTLSQTSARPGSIYGAVQQELAQLCKEQIEERDPEPNVPNKEPPALPPRPSLLATDEKPDVPPRAVPSPVVLRRTASAPEKRYGYRLYENVQLVRKKVSPKDAELEAFCRMVLDLRASFNYDDLDTNCGLVMNRLLESFYPDDTTVKVVVQVPSADNPVTFTCSVGTTIELLIMQVTCSLDVIRVKSATNYLLRLPGLAEYLSCPHALKDYEYVHTCIKYDKDVELVLVSNEKTKRPLSRTAKDDENDAEITLESLLPTPPGQPLTYDNLIILLETFEKECERLTSSSATFSTNLQCTSVVQTVKAICALLGQIETIKITQAIDDLRLICQIGVDKPVEVTGEMGPYSMVTLSRPSSTYDRPKRVSLQLDIVREAVYDLVHMYSLSFKVNFQLIRHPNVTREVVSLSAIHDLLRIRVGALHRLYNDWDFEEYVVALQPFHGTRPLCPRPLLCDPAVVESSQQGVFHSRVNFKNRSLEFPGLPMNSLPLESRLVVLLYGKKVVKDEGKEESHVDQTELGWAAIQLFDFKGFLIEGSHMLAVWPVAADWRLGPAPAPGTHPEPDFHPIISIELSTFDNRIEFPKHTEDAVSFRRRDFRSLDDNMQQSLLDIIERDTFTKLPPEEREVLWEKRHYLSQEPAALPKVLLAANSCDAVLLNDIHALLHQWCPLDYVSALQLLMPCFPDSEVRKRAVEWLDSSLQGDKLVDLLPQLVEALKHETWEPSPLARFLLQKALVFPRLAHHLYWLLASLLPGRIPQNTSEGPPFSADAIVESRYHRRLQLMLRALLAIVGGASRERCLSQQLLDKTLFDVAEHLKETKEALRITTLLRELETLHYTLEETATALPLGPGKEVCGMDVKQCSYFTSNTLPLRLSFKTQDNSLINAIYKVGDDLRQDQLTLQMIQIMDKLWLKEGLDLKIVAFDCIPTGYRRGMVELVDNAETLRRIQTELGLTGSFKDRSISEWLGKHNPSQLEYQRAVHNFTASCAGYSVATYVLGVCDRHNDNIMLTTSGHLFHIDFGKFLGDAQMFGTFKRDRGPFVLTSDMVYVINGGEKQSDRFHHFVDLCCQAYNIVRKHGTLLLTLFALMASSGVPGVSMEAVNYVQGALLPDLSNAEASAHFARLIDEAMRSWFTQVNFFLHNLAQLRFTGDHNDSVTLSFVPKTYTMQTDGRLHSVEVYGFQKRYDPEKYYVFILRVNRDGQPGYSYLFRSYKEFCEFHQKLCLSFPLAKIHSLPRGATIGRSNVKQVAAKRRIDVSKFIQSLFCLSEEIAHCPLVYTFFHPLLRDQQESDVTVAKLKGPEALGMNSSLDISTGSITGQLKLSLHYRRGALAVLVQHARHLECPGGQEPNAYVKVYLQPDSLKRTKRKTKVVRRNRHPSFMEMLEYRLPHEVIHSRTLEASVWHHDNLQENAFLGAVTLHLSQLPLIQEVNEWFPLEVRKKR